MSELVGYAYHNPSAREFKDFEVVPASRDGDLIMPAGTMYEVITQAIVTEYARTLSAERLAVVLATRREGEEGEALDALHRRLTGNSGETGKPLYLHAQVPSPIEDDFAARLLTGVGKADYADGRPRQQRSADPEGEGAANLADIGDVYVLPTLSSLERSPLQGQGQGSAIVRSMLDHYPADMPAVIYEYPELNPRIVPLIESLGFKAVAFRLDTFLGLETSQTRYEGPLCGDLIENLETRHPWLRDRESISVAGQG
jgi:hypothetical protein